MKLDITNDNYPLHERHFFYTPITLGPGFTINEFYCYYDDCYRVVWDGEICNPVFTWIVWAAVGELGPLFDVLL